MMAKLLPCQLRANKNYHNKLMQQGYKAINLKITPAQAEHLNTYKQLNPLFNLSEYLRTCIMSLEVKSDSVGN